MLPPALVRPGGDAGRRPSTWHSGTVYVTPAPVVAVAAAAPDTPPPPPSPPATLPAPTVRSARPMSSAADLEALNDPSPQARAEAGIRLGRLKDARAVKPLVRLLQEDQSPEVRVGRAKAWG